MAEEPEIQIVDVGGGANEDEGLNFLQNSGLDD